MLEDIGDLQEKLKNVVSQIHILQKEKKVLEEQIIKTKDKCYKKMISIVNRWMSKDKKTDVARLMFKALENGGRCLLSSDVNSKYIKNPGTFYHLTNEVDSRDWNLIFTQEGDYHCIRQEVIKYLAMKKHAKETKNKSPVKSKVSDKAISPRTSKTKALLKQKQAQ